MSDLPASLLEELDSTIYILLFFLILINLPTEKLLVLLRDGRTLIGFLRSIDQFCKWSFFVTKNSSFIFLFLFITI